MPADGEFERQAKAGLALYGIEVDDADLAVIGALYDVYGPLQHQLLATDFAQVPPEPDMDPSRPPTGS